MQRLLSLSTQRVQIPIKGLLTPATVKASKLLGQAPSIPLINRLPTGKQMDVILDFKY